MKNNKEQVAFVAASLIELADMSETDLRELMEIVGVNAIQEILNMESLRYDLTYEEMAEEICDFIGWEPMLTNPPREDAELDRLGRQIAELIGPVQHDTIFVAEQLMHLLCSDETDEIFKESSRD